MQSISTRSNKSLLPLLTSTRGKVLLFIVMFLCIFSITPLLVLAGESVGVGLLLGATVALVAAFLIVRYPVIGFLLVGVCATLVEQDALPTPIGTDHLYIYSWPPNLEGLIERPIGFMIIFVFFVFICHRLSQNKRILQGGALIFPLSLYMLCVAAAVFHGLTSGGTLKIVVIEVRPFWYMFLSYLLAYNLVSHKNHVSAFFWLVIVDACVKSLQGLYIFLVIYHGHLDGAHEIMAHEESFFFASLLLLLVIFCMHHRYRPQFYAALLVAPGVLVAMVANQRRTDYIALIVGIAVAWALVFCIKRSARKLLLVGMLLCVAVGGGYLAIAPQLGGVLAAPANGIISVFNPSATDTGDASSNQYRVVEDEDLKYTALQNPLFGWGFGKEFLQPVRLTDISSLDPNYLYVPHNTIYWIWMRLGIIGYMIFWFFIGSVIVKGSMIARRLHDPYLQVVAIYIVAATFMQVIVAYADYQFFMFRNVIYFGLLVGMLVKLPALDRTLQQNVALENAEHTV